VVSQRGTMFSVPALTCAAADDFARELLSLRFYSEATERAHLAATQACHRELAATGADPSVFASAAGSRQFVERRLSLFQIGGIVPLGEPRHDRLEQGARLAGPPLALP
jgi:hypothetical protein